MNRALTSEAAMSRRQTCWVVVSPLRVVAVFGNFAEGINLASELNGLTPDEQVRLNEVGPDYDSLSVSQKVANEHDLLVRKAWRHSAAHDSGGWFRVEEHKLQVPPATEVVEGRADGD